MEPRKALDSMSVLRSDAVFIANLSPAASAACEKLHAALWAGFARMRQNRAVNVNAVLGTVEQAWARPADRVLHVPIGGLDFCSSARFADDVGVAGAELLYVRDIRQAVIVVPYDDTPLAPGQ